MKHLPESFLQQMQADLGAELPDFLKALEEKPPVSIRLNPRKKLPELSNLPIAAPVAWVTNASGTQQEGYYLSERPSFTLDPTFHAGAYYVQEASSMFIAEAVSQLIDCQDVTVLDLCAAPGGKSTLLASILRGNSLLIANEVIKSRVDILKENIVKWGYPNVIVSNHDSDDFIGLESFFDIVLVDAPCSGEGLFRKDEKAMDEWSPESVQTCSARQKRILANAVKLVKPNGLLLYSTCTYNDFENKNNVIFISENTDFQSVSLDSVRKKTEIDHNNDTTEGYDIVEKIWHPDHTQSLYGYQFYPHRIKGEGFFLSIFKNNTPVSERSPSDSKTLNVPKLSLEKLPKKQVELASKWLKNPDHFEFFQKHNGDIYIVLKNKLQHIALIDKVLKRKSLGIVIGTFKGSDFIPSHDLALSIEISDVIPFVILSKTNALKYLKKENFDLPDDAPQGWVLARYEGLNIGWMKVMKNRINNYLPTEFRIRMPI